MIALISAEASDLRDFLASLDTEAWSRPSACAGWTIGDVLAHLTQGASTWSATITRAIAGDANPPPGEQTLRPGERGSEATAQDRKSRRLNSSHVAISYAVLCLNRK